MVDDRDEHMSWQRWRSQIVRRWALTANWGLKLIKSVEKCPVNSLGTWDLNLGVGTGSSSASADFFYQHGQA
jgi:hypothetical protein